MALSRTARILIAILLLAAAAFFWVNFFYQSRLAETPAQDPVTATPPTPASAGDAVAQAADEPGAAPAAVEGDAVAADPMAEATDGDALTDATTASETPEGADADAIVVADDPAVIVVNVPVAVSREVVIADLPFLLSSPPAAGAELEDDAADATAPSAVAVPTRATINPFSPVVVRTPPPPTREVPAGATVVTDVPVPAAPAGASAPGGASAPAAAVRAAAPTPRPLAPASTVAGRLTRELPTGSVLSSTPDLLRKPRVGTVADRVDLPAITAIAVPEAEPATVAAPPAQRTPVPVVDLQPVGPIAAVAPVSVGPEVAVDRDAPVEPDVAVDPDASVGDAVTVNPAVSTAAPLQAGTTRLSRFLREYDYAFTGSVMGPVSVGVFRSLSETTPIVVALGQTLPNTEIVLTDLRGMQAELTLGDSTQILSLDLRR